MTHVSSRKNHGFGRGFFKNHSDAVEKCGRLPGGHDNNERFLQIRPKEMETLVTYTPEESTTDSVFNSAPAPEKSVVTDVSSGQLCLLERGVFGKIYEQEDDSPTSDGRQFRNIGAENELASSTGIGLLALDHELEMECVHLTNKDVVPEMLIPEPLDSKEPTSASCPESTVDRVNRTQNYNEHDQSITRSHEMGEEAWIKEEPIDDESNIIQCKQMTSNVEAGPSASAKESSSNTMMIVSGETDTRPSGYYCSSGCARSLSYPMDSLPKRPGRRASVATDYH